MRASIGAARQSRITTLSYSPLRQLPPISDLWLNVNPNWSCAVSRWSHSRRYRVAKGPQQSQLSGAQLMVRSVLSGLAERARQGCVAEMAHVHVTILPASGSVARLIFCTGSAHIWAARLHTQCANLDRLAAATQQQAMRPEENKPLRRSEATDMPTVLRICRKTPMRTQ